jgi:menaquinone-dependent protoporphyrinogen IX oxidase
MNARQRRCFYGERYFFYDKKKGDQVKTIIYYYSATGNSLSAARCIAEDRMSAKDINVAIMKNIVSVLLVLILVSIAGASGGNMKNVLIVYGSFSGSTVEIADTIKKSLENKQCAVVAMPAEDNKIDLSKYDLVIIGSAIRGDNIHPKIKAFIDANRSGLKQKKVAVFAACITITSSKPAKREHALGYPQKVACGLSPVNQAVFAGKAPSSGWLGNKLGKWILGIVPGDYRDWDKIKSWTGSLIEHDANKNN